MKVEALCATSGKILGLNESCFPSPTGCFVHVIPGAQAAILRSWTSKWKAHVGNGTSSSGRVQHSELLYTELTSSGLLFCVDKKRFLSYVSRRFCLYICFVLVVDGDLQLHLILTNENKVIEEPKFFFILDDGTSGDAFGKEQTS